METRGNVSSRDKGVKSQRIVLKGYKLFENIHKWLYNNKLMLKIRPQNHKWSICNAIKTQQNCGHLVGELVRNQNEKKICDFNTKS
jgi:hypothetical protein